MSRRRRLRLACHVTLFAAGAATLVGCRSHPGPDRLEAMSPGCTTHADGVSMAWSATATVAAYHDPIGDRCVFGGSVTTLTTGPLRISIRPAKFSVSDDMTVGLDASWGALRRTPIRRGDEVVIPPRDPVGRDGATSFDSV